MIVSYLGSNQVGTHSNIRWDILSYNLAKSPNHDIGWQSYAALTYETLRNIMENLLCDIETATFSYIDTEKKFAIKS